MIVTGPSHPGNSGSITVELVVIAPVLMMFVLLASALGRYESLQEDVTQSAGSAAAVAVVAGSASEARQSAVEAARLALGTESSCLDEQVVVDTNDFSPGGVVTVTVQCQVSLADLFLPGFRGSATIRETESAPIDPYRVIEP